MLFLYKLLLVAFTCYMIIKDFKQNYLGHYRGESLTL